MLYIDKEAASRNVPKKTNMEKDKKLVGARPIYKKLLIAAIVIYVIGSCIIQADLYRKIGEIEHEMMHALCCGHHK